MVRVSASGGGGPGFNPHHVSLSGLEVRPLKVSGGSPVHLRSNHQELVGKTLWVKQNTTYKYIYIYIYLCPLCSLSYLSIFIVCYLFVYVVLFASFYVLFGCLTIMSTTNILYYTHTYIHI